ncbi:MAG: YgjP-like metallopeptidase domain-containing protein [Candidatus Micrarchaeota archaeon]
MEMQSSLTGVFGDAQLITHIRRVRYSRIRIPSSRQVIVTGRNAHSINEILREKKSWVEKKLQQLKQMEDTAAVADGQFYYFGEPAALEQFDALSAAALSRKLRSELQQQAKSFLDQHTLIQPKLAVRRMRSRLGVYSSKDDEIRLSVYLAFLPRHLIDYIVYHEFTHRDVRNHGSRFWNKMSERYPDWKQKEKELDLWWLRAKLQAKKYTRLGKL